MLRIRLMRMGRRNDPKYRIVLTDARVKRQGGYLEKLGTYDPGLVSEEKKVLVSIDRIRHWIDQGARVSEPVVALLRKRGLNVVANEMEKRLQRKKAVKAKRASKQKVAG